MPEQQAPQKSCHKTNIWMIIIPIVFIAVLFILYTFVRGESATEKKISRLVTKNESALTDVAGEYQKEVNALEKELEDIKEENLETADTSDWLLYDDESFPFTFLYPADLRIMEENIPDFTVPSVILSNIISTMKEKLPFFTISLMLEKESKDTSLEQIQTDIMKKYIQSALPPEDDELKIYADEMIKINGKDFYHLLVGGSYSLGGWYFSINNNTLLTITYGHARLENETEINRIIATTKSLISTMKEK